MLLHQSYKECQCGASLNKRNRFAIKLETPEHINTQKREKECQPLYFKTVVIYLCEKCHNTIKNKISHELNSDWKIYYPDSYPC